jgi:RNA polymerase sigma factor (sigma-70 family)
MRQTSGIAFVGAEWTVNRPRHQHDPSERAILALSARIVTVCVLAGLCTDDAQDVSQDILKWLIVSGNLTMAATLPWLHAVIRNFVRRYWRRRGRDLDLRETLGRYDEVGLNFAAEIEFKRTVEEILPTLGARDREIFSRMALEDLSFAEAADAIDIQRGSRGRIRNRLRRASAPLLPQRRKRGRAAPD